MSEVNTQPWLEGRSEAPTIMIHVLRENKRPVGFAPWPKEKKVKKEKK